MRELKLQHSITRRDNDAVNRYLGEIGRIPLLTVPEEVILTKRIKSGDPAAVDYLIKTNLRFVVSVAKQYQNRGLSLGDLINEGNVGLIKAATRFDDTKGFKFISFAVWWIRQAIMEAIAEQTRMVRLPMNVVNSITKVNKVAAELEQKLERKPTNAEIADVIQLDQPKVTSQLLSARKCKSLDEVVDLEIGSTLLDVLVAEDPRYSLLLPGEYEERELQQLLYPLTGRERKILILYFGLGGFDVKSLEDIGAMFNLSRERTRQLKDIGIKKIRMHMERKKKQ